MNDGQISAAVLEEEMCQLMYVIGVAAGAAYATRWPKGYDIIRMIVDGIRAGLYKSGLGSDELAALNDAFWHGHLEGVTRSLVEKSDDLPASA